MAFPFSTLKVVDGELSDSVRTLTALVAALAQEADVQHPSEAAAELVARAEALVRELAAD